jgi:hypothetical protein
MKATGCPRVAPIATTNLTTPQNSRPVKLVKLRHMVTKPATLALNPKMLDTCNVC